MSDVGFVIEEGLRGSSILLRLAEWRETYSAISRFPLQRWTVNPWLDCVRKDPEAEVVDLGPIGTQVRGKGWETWLEPDRYLIAAKSWERLSELTQEWADFLGGNEPVVRVYHLSGGHLDYRQSRLNPSPVEKELYADLDIQALAEQFRSAPERLLIVSGVPGTGKSYLARYLIESLAKALPGEGLAYVQDREAAESGAFWAEIQSESPVCLVCDDFDGVLAPRAQQESKFIHYLLAAADGVLQTRCKFLVTTNQPIDRIDPALLRPGRCFDLLHLRPLLTEEARGIWHGLFWEAETVPDFDQVFPEVGDTVTQAKLMQGVWRVRTGFRLRSYWRTGPQSYTVEERAAELGIETDPGRPALGGVGR